ncbi:hypothetical protein ON010_g11110 [Phytophthora cinnamomi]|nr:hypothetical protein ON010_g11110 [Phytophthora cinnamomi]
MASSQKIVLITGSTRGIGLAFVEHYVKAGWNVIATARANSNTDKPDLTLLDYLAVESAFSVQGRRHGHGR